MYDVFVSMDVLNDDNEDDFIQDAFTFMQERGMKFRAVLSASGFEVYGALFSFETKEEAIPLMLAGGIATVPLDCQIDPTMHDFDEGPESF